MSTTSIPFLDLVASHISMEQELVEVFRNALHTAGFVGGKPVQRFEDAFAGFCETEYCIGVASGTDALLFALLASGVSQGDSVITVPNTFIATAEAITQAGAIPEFVDVDERTYNMDPIKLHEFLESECDRDEQTGKPVSRRTGRTVTAIVPVHLYGQMAEMDAIVDLANAHNLVVVEDSCQAHGAEYLSRKQNRWRRAGSIGKAAAFSFYPGKNLGACGEGGAVTTNNHGVAETIRKLRDHGQSTKYYHEIEGYNGRLDTIQAGILHAKLSHLEEWNNCRRQIANLYAKQLSHTVGLVVPFEPDWSKAVYHLYVVRVPDRETMRKALGEAGVGTGIHYPIPLHLQQAYQKLGYQAGDFPVTERIAEEILSLPMYPQLTQEQQMAVVDTVRQCIPCAVEGHQ